MIGPDKRKAIYLLHLEGEGVREISRLLGPSHKAVAKIIKQKGEMPLIRRKDKIRIDPELLRRLYGQCGGWMQRVHERLVEEEKVPVGYATLTRLLRELGISGSSKQRCDRVPDEPGAEFQHDTSPYQVKLGDKVVRVVASLLYLRYSKRRYLKFYRAFNRFKMKLDLRRSSHKKRNWVRADIILRAANGQTNYMIAKNLRLSRNTVHHWRYRFARERLAGLMTRPIPGRPKRITAVQPGNGHLPMEQSQPHGTTHER